MPLPTKEFRERKSIQRSKSAQPEEPETTFSGDSEAPFASPLFEPNRSSVFHSLLFFVRI
jgi:hypothetical protein